MLGSSSIVANIIIRAQNLTQREFAQVSDDMRAVEGEASTFGSRFAAAANGVSSFLIRVGAIGGVLAAFSIHAASAFQSAEAQIHSFAGATESETQAAANAALHLASVYGESATKIVASMYDVYSAGIKGREALQIEAAGTEAAAASHAKLDDVMKALTTTMLDYPHAFKNAHDAAGQMSKVVQEGRMHWEDYARSISTVEPIASALHMSFSQVGAMLVELTRHGNTANESTRMLRNTIMQLILPNVQARNAAQALGLSWQVLFAHGGGLINTLHSLVDAGKLNALSEQQVADATGYHGIRAARLTELLKNHETAVRVLSGTTLSYATIMQTLGSRDYPALMKAQSDITHGAQSLDQAWKGVSHTTQAQGAIMRETIRTLGIEIGTVLLPAVMAFLGVLEPFARQVAVIASEHHALTAIIAGTALGFLALGAAMKASLVIVDVYRQGFVMLRAALEIMGVIDRQTASTNALSASQQRSSASAAMEAASQERLKIQRELAAAAAEGDASRVNLLIAADSNLQMKMEALAQSEAQAGVAARDLSVSQTSLAETSNKLADAQARQVGAERVAAQSETELGVAAQRLRGVQWELAASSDAMGRANNEVRSAQAALNREMVSAGAVTDQERQAVLANTAAGRGYTDALRQQQEAIAQYRAQLAAVRGEEAAVREATIANTASLEAQGAATRDVTALETALKIQSGEVVAETEAETASRGELAIATDGLMASLGGLATVEGITAAATGVLTTALDFLAANPIVAVALVVAALVIGLYELYQHCQLVRDAVNSLASLFGSVLYAAGQKVSFILHSLGDLLGAIGSKIQFVTGTGNAFLGILEILFPELTPFIQLFEHWDEVMGFVSDKFDGLMQKLHDFNNLLTSSTPILGGLTDGLKLLSGDLSHVGSQMDQHRHSTDSMIQGHERLRESLSQTGETIRTKLGIPLDASVAQVRRAAAAFQAGNAQIAASIKQMTDQAKLDMAGLDDTSSHVAAHVADTWILNMERARAGIIAQIQAVRNETAKPILFAPMAPPDMSGVKTDFKGGPGSDTAATTATMTQINEHLDALKTQLASLPSGFEQAGNAIASGFNQQIAKAHADFLAGMKAENDRHAQALNAINSGYIAQQKSEYDRYKQALASENSSYLSRLKTILDDHAQKIAQYLQTQSIAFQNAAANFQASMAQFDNRLNQINDIEKTTLTNLHNSYLQKLDAIHGKYAAEQRRTLENWYNRERGLVENRFSNERRLVEEHINGLAQAFKNHNVAEENRMKAWLANEQATFNHHVEGVNRAHTQHVKNINETHSRHVSGITNAHTTHVNKENQVHQHHIDGLTKALNAHISKIEAAMKVVSSPAGLWDKLTQAANNLADGAMKALALKFLEHAKVTNADIQAVVKAQQTQSQMADAMNKATLAVLNAGGAAGKLKLSMDQISTAVNSAYKNALDAVTRDIMAGRQPTAEHLRALQQATNQQNRLTAAQAKAEKIAESDGAKHKKTADEWVQALSNAKNAVDTKLNSAIAQWVLASQNGQTSLGGLTAQIQKYALQQQQLANREAQAQAIAQAAILRLPPAVALAANAFDSLKKTTDDRLKVALSAAAQEFLNTGRISAGTTASLHMLQMQSDRLTAAQQAAENAAQGLDQSYDGIKKRLDDLASKTLNDYTTAVYKAANGDLQAAASLDTLKAKAVAAAQSSAALALAEERAKRSVDEETLARQGDYNSTLQHAKMVYEDALAAYEDAVMHHASAEAIAQLRQAADDAAVALKGLEQIASDAEAAIYDDTGYGTGSDQLTAQQQFSDQMSQQNFNLKQQQDAFTQQYDEQKLALQEQKAANQTSNSNQTQTNQTLSQMLKVEQEQLVSALEMIALQNKMMYLSRLGLSRVLVGSMGSETQWLNSLGGESYANPTAT